MRQRTTTTASYQRHVANVRRARQFADCLHTADIFGDFAGSDDCPDYALGMLTDLHSNPFAALLDAAE